MATDVERLVVQLSADVKKYENALNRAMGATNQRTKAIERRFQSMNGNIGAGFTALGRNIAGAFAVAGGLRGMQTLLDSATRIDNALKVAGLSGAELEKVYGRLRDSAVKNAAPLESLVTLYGRASLVQKELNVTQEEMLNFSDKIALALRVSGQSAAESSGALLQLSQALGSGVVRAEEFNSVLEGALPIAQAAAAGLKEAGGSVSKLRQLVVDGKISSEAFFRAFEAGSVVLEGKVAGATLTTAQALENVHTALIDAMRDFAKGSLAAEDLGQAFQAMADRINGVDFKVFGEQVRTAIQWIGELKNALSFVENAGANFGAATGLDQFGVWLSEKTGIDIATSHAKERKGFWEAQAEADIKARNEAYAKVLADPTQYGPQLPSVDLFSPGPSTRGGRRGGVTNLAPVSIDDFAPPTGKKSGSGKKKRKNEYEREIQQIKERTAALQAETAAQAGLNPLVNDYGFALAKARAESDLLAAAQQQGLTITPQLRASIEALAVGYANASVAAEKLADSQDKARQTADEFKSMSKDIASGFISDLRSGASAADALSNALNKVLDKLIDIGLNSILGIGGGGGGLLGGIGKIFGFADGGYTGNGGKYQPAGVVHKGEYVFNKETTKKLGAKNLAKLAGYAKGGFVGSAPSLPSMSGTLAKQQQVSVTVGVSSDNNGNLMPFVQSIAQREVSTAAPAIVNAANQQVVPTMSKFQNNKAGAEWRG